MVIGGDIFISTELMGGYINEVPMARFLDEEIESGGVVKAYNFVSAKFDTFHLSKDQTLSDLSNFNEYTINLYSVSETALEATNQRYYEPTELYGDKLSASTDEDIFKALYDFKQPEKEVTPGTSLVPVTNSRRETASREDKQTMPILLSEAFREALSIDTETNNHVFLTQA